MIVNEFKQLHLYYREHDSSLDLFFNNDDYAYPWQQYNRATKHLAELAKQLAEARSAYLASLTAPFE